jgi:hypothetical protein
MRHVSVVYLVLSVMLTACLLMLLAVPTLAQPPETTPTVTATPSLLENVPMKAGGLEVFPQPTRKSTRIFAAVGTFAPHVAGKNQAGDWLYIYYFDGKALKAGWSPRNQLSVKETDLNILPIIDPANPPVLPDLPYNARAARPYGARRSTTTPAATLVPQPDPPSGSGNPGGPTLPPTEPPPTDPFGTPTLVGG